MLFFSASCIMRTTLDLDLPILRELKNLSQSCGESLGTVATRLLAEALSAKKREKVVTPKLHWISRPMGAKVDLSDKDALYKILDQS